MRKSQYDAAFIATSKNDDLVQNLNKLRKSASLGNDAASIALGSIYFRGRNGVRRNYIEAAYWFEKVNLKNDVTGFVASHLATIYYKGLGTAKNQDVAVKYLRNAALHGNKKSQVLFAILLKKSYAISGKSQSAETILKASVCDSSLSIRMRFLALIWSYF